MNTSRDQIKTFCQSLGFGPVGFIKPSKYKTYPHYKKWINAGYHGEMHYLASERSLNFRESPLALMPECKTIIVLAFRYPGDTLADKNDQSDIPLIASYARGVDYHIFLPAHVQQIVAYIQESFKHEINALCFTDSAPILEKELGVQAGLGWIGKNSCLINPKIGSYFFISEILLDVDLFSSDGESESQISDHCGNCRRCIDVCPTHCILDDRTLDASNCIAYLTIENKGSIPDEVRTLVGNHLFGCDLCQQVCPWNNMNNERIEDLPGNRLFFEHLKSAINEPITENKVFNHYFKDTALFRSKRHGFYRNLAVTMGNLPLSINLSVLKSLIKDPSLLVRQHAMWALNNFPENEISTLLRNILKDEMDNNIRGEIELILKTKETQK